MSISNLLELCRVLTAKTFVNAKFLMIFVV